MIYKPMNKREGLPSRQFNEAVIPAPVAITGKRRSGGFKASPSFKKGGR